MGLTHVAEAIIGEYKKNQNLSGSFKQTKPQSANKLSAVKPQKLNPQWNSTRSSDQAPKPHNQQGQKKQRGGKNHKGKGKAQQTHIASSGVIPDAGSLPAPNIGSSQTAVVHTPSYTPPDLPAKKLLDRIKKNPQIASGVKPGEFGIWTSANQARTLAERIGITPTTETLHRNELLIEKVRPFQPFQGLRFNKKRKTPEPDEISLGSESEQEPVDPEDMVDYGVDFSDDGFMDYGEENDMQTVN
ncbi:hypothetical protein H0H81_007671, partial [Sphagnurus paluster]